MDNVALMKLTQCFRQFCFRRNPAVTKLIVENFFLEQGFDLFFYDIGDYYLTFVGTARGDDMVLATGSLFESVTREDIDEYKRRSEDKRGAFQLDVEIRDLPEIFETPCVFS